MKRKIDSSTILGDFSAPLSLTDKARRSTTVKKKIEQHPIPARPHRHLYPIAEQTFFSSVHRTFSRIDHKLGLKTSLNEFKNQKSYNICSITTMG